VSLQDLLNPLWRPTSCPSTLAYPFISSNHVPTSMSGNPSWQRDHLSLGILCHEEESSESQIPYMARMLHRISPTLPQQWFQTLQNGHAVDLNCSCCAVADNGAPFSAQVLGSCLMDTYVRFYPDLPLNFRDPEVPVSCRLLSPASRSGLLSDPFPRVSLSWAINEARPWLLRFL
jgi:hypothetical protein